MEEVCVIKTGPLLSSGPVIKGKWGGQHQPHTEVVWGMPPLKIGSCVGLGDRSRGKVLLIAAITNCNYLSV